MKTLYRLEAKIRGEWTENSPVETSYEKLKDSLEEVYTATHVFVEAYRIVRLDPVVVFEVSTKKEEKAS